MRRLLLCGALAAVGLMATASSAFAEFGPSTFGVNPEFGFQQFSVAAVNRDGSPDVQAGSHPYALITTFTMNLGHAPEHPHRLELPADQKDLSVELPPGFVGDPNVVPKCSYFNFITNTCPPETVVGVATVYLASNFVLTKNVPVYNMEASPGVTAEFAFTVAGQVEVFINVGVRTGGDYGLTTHTVVTQTVGDYATKVTIWGVPAEASHDPYRGRGCLDEETPLEFFRPIEGEPIGVATGLGGEIIRTGLGEGEDERESPYFSGASCPSNVPARPLLTNPTSCGVPRTARITANSWQDPADVASRTFAMPEITGCEKLDFSPGIAVTPDGQQGSTPTGLNVGVHVPQESTINPAGAGEADVRDTTVTLPAGVQLNPAASDGLLACSEAQVGLHDAEKPSCPDASKIANVRIKTPLLEEELTGSVYLASPQNFAGPLENPFGSLLAIYLVAEDPTRGVSIKVAGKVSPNEQTGQLTTTFENTPQLPFEQLTIEFYGTDRAPLATPGHCGRYSTQTSFAPWSGTAAAHPVSSFQITSGPGGSPCPGSSLPFEPSLNAGSTNIQAGAFSPFTLTMSRQDGQQPLQSIKLQMPAGLSGVLTDVKLCKEAPANAGTCGPESLIGETTVSVGLGNDPYTVTGGKVYLTEGYEGAPFGLSIVNPATAGPFVLQEGRPVVVRAKVEVNPLTAALTVTSATGTHGIPTIIDGVPLQIKHVNVLINRPDFTFNPTNCNQTQIAGTIASAEGSSWPDTIPFQVTNCGGLAFKPQFSVSTSAKTSRADGASLGVKLTYPKAPFGTQANVDSVHVELPKALPSRLTTLNHACLDSVFNQDPADCPSQSRVGFAKAITPILPVPLEGPAYFVSHGGHKFPELIMVLQGYGVTVDLEGETFISKNGVTSSTFPSVPDVPVGSFELTLPEGQYSALAANGDLCAEKLVMPTTFTAQSGAVVEQKTPISVEGCRPEIRVLRHSVKGKHATVVVSVPSAGILIAGGHGVSRVSKDVASAGVVTVTLRLSAADQRFVARHHNRRLMAPVRLSFRPTRGKRLQAQVAVLMR